VGGEQNHLCCTNVSTKHIFKKVSLIMSSGGLKHSSSHLGYLKPKDLSLSYRKKTSLIITSDYAPLKSENKIIYCQLSTRQNKIEGSWPTRTSVQQELTGAEISYRGSKAGYGNRVAHRARG